MSVPSVDFTDCSVLIYDVNGTQLIRTSITVHDRKSNQIEIQTMPFMLSANSECRLLILSSPAPHEYLGMIKKVGALFTIALLQGQVKEDRNSTRYKVNSPALITSYTSLGRQHEPKPPIKITLVNISSGGVKVRTPYNTLNKGDVFRFNLEIGGNLKIMTAEVIHVFDNEPHSSDYGCKFILTD